MNCITAACSRRSALLGALLVLAGCGSVTRQAGDPAAFTPPRAAIAPQDALGRFVAAAGTGQEGVVTLADAGATRVRVVRAYAAASGRNCRELLMGEGIGGRTSLLCEADGHWVPARPLLLGSAAARP